MESKLRWYKFPFLIVISSSSKVTNDGQNSFLLDCANARKDSKALEVLEQLIHPISKISKLKNQPKTNQQIEEKIFPSYRFKFFHQFNSGIFLKFLRTFFAILENLLQKIIFPISFPFFFLLEPVHQGALLSVWRKKKFFSFIENEWKILSQFNCLWLIGDLDCLISND